MGSIVVICLIIAQTVTLLSRLASAKRVLRAAMTFSVIPALSQCTTPPSCPTVIFWMWLTWVIFSMVIWIGCPVNFL
jgi:hypothetical protein